MQTWKSGYNPGTSGSEIALVPERLRPTYRSIAKVWNQKSKYPLSTYEFYSILGAEAARRGKQLEEFIKEISVETTKARRKPSSLSK